MIHLDTHVALWLSAGTESQLTAGVRALIDANDSAVSPMVEVELAVLREIGRITSGPAEIFSTLHRSLGLIVDPTPFGEVSAAAATEQFAFTRDPFDRVIAAQAAAAGVELLTKDRTLRNHLDFAIWD